MKKDIGLVTIIMLSASLILLPSCSLNLTNPVEPEINTSSEVVPSTCGIGDLIESGEISIKPLNPGYGHFLQFLLEGIYGGYIEFVKESYKIPYINKIEAVLTVH